MVERVHLWTIEQQEAVSERIAEHIVVCSSTRNKSLGGRPWTCPFARPMRKTHERRADNATRARAALLNKVQAEIGKAVQFIPQDSVQNCARKQNVALTVLQLQGETYEFTPQSRFSDRIFERIDIDTVLRILDSVELVTSW